MPFAYDLPTVVAAARADRDPLQCLPLEQCTVEADSVAAGGNVTRYCKSVPAGCYDTAGGYPLEVIGASFGMLTAVVTVGGRPCPLSAEYAQDHNSIVCVVPQGLGDANAVVVTAGMLNVIPDETRWRAVRRFAVLRGRPVPSTIAAAISDIEAVPPTAVPPIPLPASQVGARAA